MSPILHPRVLAAMAQPAMRLSHLLWHGVRDYWMRLSDAQQAAFVTQFGSEWVPARPSRNKRGEVILNNRAGLDFLFMHRHMICQVNCILKQARAKPIVGFKRPPMKDSEYPVVRDYRLPPEVYASKDDAVWKKIVSVTGDLLTPANLKNIHPAELGTRIEYGIHAAMHERFGGYSTSGRLRLDQTDILKSPTSTWNLPGYDTLLDSYAAHVHPGFWKIHGWVDSCLDAWERENKCQILWDTWMGGMQHGDCGHDHHPQHKGPKLSTLIEAVDFLTRAGMSSKFTPALYVLNPGMEWPGPTLKAPKLKMPKLIAKERPGAKPSKSPGHHH